MVFISIIVAYDLNNGIGYENRLPWNIKEDLKYFKNVTEGKTVIMGKNTYYSLPKYLLPKRRNIIITKTPGFYNKSTETYQSLEKAIECLNIEDLGNNAFIIGGAQLYRYALKHKLVDDILASEINSVYKCDTFFPLLLQGSVEELPCNSYNIKSNTVTFKRYLLKNKNMHEEYQYLCMVNEVLNTGYQAITRNKAVTMSKFGFQHRYSLENSVLPVLTTKRVFIRGVIEELLWFLKGSTDASYLKNKNIHIWDAHSSQEYLDSIGLNYEEGDIGPGYGFQWRNSGAKYLDCKTNYSHQGRDQIKWVINELKTNPNSRRLIISSWNVGDLPDMALPPCHCIFQFYVNEKGLSCQMYQRSADIGLGVPFNITSYALLTHIIANQVGIQAYEFIHVIGNAHVYEQHIEPLNKQINLSPFEFPQIQIKEGINFEELKYEHFNLLNYKHHNTIKMDIIV
jgi:dihydrofolate reductase / thymidylate synthase